MSARLAIAHTWDGHPLPEGACASVTLSWAADALRIEVDAPWARDPSPPGRPGPTDGLWNHEVVELFVACGSRYTEVEIGPYGHHLVLQLDGVRSPVASQLPLALTTERTGDRWRAVAQLDRRWLVDAPTTCNAYRIAGVGDARRYHAHAAVPGPQPDFHRLQHFVGWPLQPDLY